eukprot:6535555-Prymnesium_polylepis.1
MLVECVCVLRADGTRHCVTRLTWGRCRVSEGVGEICHQPLCAVVIEEVECCARSHREEAVEQDCA